MAHLGLVKWFNLEKGYGLIGTSDSGDVFLHHNNMDKKPRAEFKCTALIFDIKDEKGKKNAVNIHLPRNYSDFICILSYLSKPTEVEIEVPVRRHDRRGILNERNEKKSFSVIKTALYQFFNDLPSHVVIDYFKKYFDDTFKNTDDSLFLEYLKLTIERFQRFKFENTEENINSTIEYYLKNIGQKILFQVWQKKLFPVTQSIFASSKNLGYPSVFPDSLFVEQYSVASQSDLERIIDLENGIQIATDIVACQLHDVTAYSKSKLESILESFEIINKNETSDNLQDIISKKLLFFLTEIDYSQMDDDIIKDFEFIVHFLETSLSENKYQEILITFNNQISGDVAFQLWQRTQYFDPGPPFFWENMSRMNLEDFMSASHEFHREYIIRELDKLEKIETIESFGLLIFLIVETPVRIFKEIFARLLPKHKAALWISFFWGKEYQLNQSLPYRATADDFEYSDVDFLKFIQSSDAITNLVQTWHLIQKVKEEYNKLSRETSPPTGFLKMSISDRKTFLHKFHVISKEQYDSLLIKLFDLVLKNSRSENVKNFFEFFVPNFINEKNYLPVKITELIRDLRLDEKTSILLFNYFGQSSSRFTKVWLWLHGYSSQIEFIEAIEEFNNFQGKEQHNLLRKIFTLIHRNKGAVPNNYTDRLISLSITSNLSLDISIVLAVIRCLHNNSNYPSENTISEIICQFVGESVNELIQISDVFEECKGRTWMTPGENKVQWYLNIEGKDFEVHKDRVHVDDSTYPFDKDRKIVTIEGEEYSYKWSKKVIPSISKLYEKPKGVTFCDAVKSEYSAELKRNFYWCCNGKCWAPGQSDHVHFEWRKYSLRDFIKILKFPFEDDKYYRFASIVNRVNRLLKKLKCSSCGNLLRDARTSEFAFYRVTTFHCTNPKCTEYHKNVYLSHCLNWRCFNVVDSRISRTCPHGWYICDECNSCCSQLKLESRLKNLYTNNAFDPSNQRHQRLKYQVDQKLGHQERGERFDFRTGIPL